MTRLTLKGGTLAIVAGCPVILGADTDVECISSDHYEKLRELSTVPFIEYPKVLPDGRTVNSAAEEHGPAVEPVAAEPVSPLDDVEIEMDNPEFQPPKKATKKK